MKKIILSAFLLTALVGSISMAAQDKIGLQKYDYVTNGDTNMFQGIPNISLPLLSLNVPTTDINIGLSLNYTTESASAFNLISDVGKGWNLSSIGSIVRNRTKEENDFTLPTGTLKEANSDVYNYNYPGGSGKFYIGMDKVSSELLGVHTSPSNDKIIVTKDDTKPNSVKSFTIVDTKGNRYLFDKININKFRTFDKYDNVVVKFINSGFFLSKIFNVKNEEVVTIEYETTTKAITLPTGSLQQQKIKKINVLRQGSIEYLYAYTGSEGIENGGNKDVYQLNSLVLKNSQNQIINQYSFKNMGSDYLRELVNLDKNNNPIQTFSFEYNREGSYLPDNNGYPIAYDDCALDTGKILTPHHTNTNSVSYNTLKRIVLPTGGITEYEFESHSVPNTQPDPSCSGPECYYDNYDIDKIYTLNYDTKIKDNFTITLPPGYQSRVFVKNNYTLYESPQAMPGRVNFINPSINNEEGNPFEQPLLCPGILWFTPVPGPIKISLYAHRKGYGTLEFYAAKQQKIDKNEYGYGLRIKSIKNYNPGSSSPLSHTRYEYATFTDPLLSSGQTIALFVEEIGYAEETKAMTPIGYTNIKVTNMINGNYSKYYFVSPYSVALTISPSFGYDDRNMTFYLGTSGILQKKEDYSPTQQLLQKLESAYELKEVPLANITTGGNPVKKVIISKQTSATESYISGSAKKLTGSSETQFEDTYGNVSLSKETLSDGTLVEQSYLYPQEKGVQKLLNANMVNIPLETNMKKNGKPVGKSETKFNDPSHLYPTSVVTYNLQNQNPVTAMTMDVYDTKGNLVQATGKSGVPTTTIWGYYGTQAIATIAGAAYAQVSSLATVTAAIAASNADYDNPANEPALVQALENLRKDPALQNYSVTGTTYDPLIGVTQSISANGIRTVNIYNTANRLIKVTDAEGKTLQENQYNYKH